MTQTEQILQHLQENGSITPMTAIMQYGITRLSARIYDLNRQGIHCNKQLVTYTAKDGKRKHYTVYFYPQDVPITQ